MATVPQPRGQTVAPNGAPLPSLSPNVPAAAFGSGVARSIGRLAEATESASNVFQEHALTLQGLENKSSADSAFVTATQLMNDIALRYKDQERGGNALPKLKDYQDELETARTEAGQGLNPMALRMYEGESRRMYSNFMGSMSSHAAEQNRQYTMNASDARINAAADAAIANAGNPEFMASAKIAITQETTFQSEYAGSGPEVAADALKRRMSKLYSGVIEQMANDDPPSAQAYFNEHKEEMVGTDIKSMDSYLKRTMQPFVAMEIADSVARGYDRTAPLSAVAADPQGFFSAIAGGEVGINSGVRTRQKQDQLIAAGRTKAVNTLHMAENGVAYDLKPPEGMSLPAFLKKLKAADLGADELGIHNGDHVHIGWKKGAKGPGGGLESASTPEEIEQMRLAGIKRVDALVDKYYGGDPSIKAAAEMRFDSIYGRRAAALNAQAQASRERIVSAVEDAGPTDLQSLFKSYPGAQNDYYLMTPTQQKAINGYLKTNANPQTKDLTFEQKQTWAYLDGESKTAPAAFAQRDLLSDPATTQLPFSMVKAFITKQNDIKAGKGIDPSEGRMMSWASPFLHEAGILQDDGKGKTTPEYAKFMSALTANARAYYDINKKYPDQIWVRQQTQALLLEQKTSLFGSQYSFEDPSKAGLVPGVPNAFTQSAITQARQRGITLTNDQIRQLYNRKVSSGGN